MGKVEDLRAIRDARYAAATASAAPRRATGASAGELCGHRAISGKTCVRERGHSEESHKYAKA